MAGNLTAMIAAAFSGGAAPPVTTDPYFEYTTLLLPGNGTNGAQNNTFLDGSTNNFTITRNGNTTQGTFSPFSQTGWSGAFNTSTTYLTVTDTANLRFGSANFTIEAWVYRNASGATQTIASKGASTPTGWVFQISSADKLVFTDTSTSITGATSIAANTWTYVAVVRAGTGTNQTTLYVNGTSDGTGTSATNFNQTSNMLVGADRSTTNFANGYISNLRLSNTNRTISSTPTTALTADANTIFLSLNLNRFQYTDSTAAYTNISVTGTPSVVAFSPFNPSASWSAATYGGSGYFDGSGDYLEAGTASNWTFLSNTTALFSIEAWVYLSSAPATLHPICFTNAASSAQIGFGFWITSSRGVGAEITIGSTGTRVLDATTTGTIQLGAWNYVAITYDQSLASGNCKIYINNAAAETFNKTGSTPSSSNPATALLIGRSNSSTHAIGYYGSLRISNVIRTITVPTAPYTSDANTQLLLNFTNAGVYDATSNNDLETVGNAQISNTTAKFGSTSIKFDGTGDYLLIRPSPVLEFGGGDFTIEFWFYSNSISTYQTLIERRSSVTVGGLVIGIYLSAVSINVGDANTSGWEVAIPGSSLSSSTWYHVALTRSGSSWKLFVNGTQQGSTATWSGTPAFETSALRIAGDVSGANTLNGYMQDIRITKGYARYTANFTAPTAAFPTL